LNDATTTIEEMRRRAIEFRDERDWRQFHAPKDLALALAIEVGELAELFLWRSRDEIDDALESADYRARLREESADVLMFLLYLSEATGVDLAASVEAKLRQNAEKYPVEMAFGSAKKYTELGRQRDPGH
jgi:NTP pyrophosphatase (non-canonical NTP hydrolase)